MLTADHLFALYTRCCLPVVCICHFTLYIPSLPRLVSKPIFPSSIPAVMHRHNSVLTTSLLMAITSQSISVLSRRKTGEKMNNWTHRIFRTQARNFMFLVHTLYSNRILIDLCILASRTGTLIYRLGWFKYGCLRFFLIFYVFLTIIGIWMSYVLIRVPYYLIQNCCFSLLIFIHILIESELLKWFMSLHLV